MTTSLAPRAAALTNRRLCMYVDGDQTSNGVLRFVVDNYKKRGECPYINSYKYPHLISQHNPVPKRTCEQVSSFVGYGDDICRILKDDELYELDFNMRTLAYTPPEDDGPVKDFH